MVAYRSVLGVVLAALRLRRFGGWRRSEAGCQRCFGCGGVLFELVLVDVLAGLPLLGGLVPALGTLLPVPLLPAKQLVRHRGRGEGEARTRVRVSGQQRCGKTGRHSRQAA